MRKLYVWPVILFVVAVLQAYTGQASAERKFPHARGEFDINLDCGSPFFAVLDAFCPENINHIANKPSELDNRLAKARKSKGSHSIEWEPYVTKNFKDSQGNTLLHALAYNCYDGISEDDFLRLLGAIKDASDYDNKVIPYSAEYALSKDSVFMPGGFISPLVRNNNKNTARDILIKDWVAQGPGLFFSPQRCKRLHEYLIALERREENDLNTREYIRTGKSQAGKL